MTTAFFESPRIRLPYLMRTNGTGMKRILNREQQSQHANQENDQRLAIDSRKTTKERRSAARTERLVHLSRKEREAGTEAVESQHISATVAAVQRGYKRKRTLNG